MWVTPVKQSAWQAHCTEVLGRILVAFFDTWDGGAGRRSSRRPARRACRRSWSTRAATSASTCPWPRPASRTVRSSAAMCLPAPPASSAASRTGAPPCCCLCLALLHLPLFSATPHGACDNFRLFSFVLGRMLYNTAFAAVDGQHGCTVCNHYYMSWRAWVGNGSVWRQVHHESGVGWNRCIPLILGFLLYLQAAGPEL